LYKERTRRRSCGNVGIRCGCGFPRTVGRVENLLLVFQTFHRPSFPRLIGWVRRFWSFLVFVDGSAEPVRFGTGLQDVSPIRDSIQQRLAEAGVRDHLRPLRKRQVGGYNHGRFFGAFDNHLKQELGTDFCEWYVGWAKLNCRTGPLQNTEITLLRPDDHGPRSIQSRQPAPKAADKAPPPTAALEFSSPVVFAISAETFWGRTC
jgi:hypothetical protein